MGCMISGCFASTGYYPVPDYKMAGDDELAWRIKYIGQADDRFAYFPPRIHDPAQCRLRPFRYANTRDGLLLIAGYIHLTDGEDDYYKHTDFRLDKNLCKFMAFDPHFLDEYEIAITKGSTSFNASDCLQYYGGSRMGAACVMNRVNEDYFTIYCQRVYGRVTAYLLKMERGPDDKLWMHGVHEFTEKYMYNMSPYNYFNGLPFKVNDENYILVGHVRDWVLHVKITPDGPKIVMWKGGYGGFSDYDHANQYIRSALGWNFDFLTKNCGSVRDIWTRDSWEEYHGGPFCELSLDSNNTYKTNKVEGAFNQYGCFRVRRGLFNYQAAPQRARGAARYDPFAYVIETFNLHTRKIVSAKCFYTPPAPGPKKLLGDVLVSWVGRESDIQTACTLGLNAVIPPANGVPTLSDASPSIGAGSGSGPAQPGGGNNPQTQATQPTTSTTTLPTTTTPWHSSGNSPEVAPETRNSSSVCQTALFPENARGNFRIIGMEPNNTAVRGIYGLPRLAVYNGVDSIPEYIGDPDGLLGEHCYVEENRIPTGVAHFGLRAVDYDNYVVFCNRGYGDDKESSVILYRYNNQTMEHLVNKTFHVNSIVAFNHFVDNRGVVMIQLNEVNYFVQMRPCVMFSVSGFSVDDPQIDIKPPNTEAEHLCSKAEILATLGTAVKYDELVKCDLHSCDYVDNQIVVGKAYDPRVYYTEDIVKQQSSFVTGRFGCYISTFRHLNESGQILNGYTFDYDPKFWPASDHSPCFMPFQWSSNFQILGFGDTKDNCSDPNGDGWDFGGVTIPVMATTQVGGIQEIPEIRPPPIGAALPLTGDATCTIYRVDTPFVVAMGALALIASVLLFATIVYTERYGRRNYEEHKRLHESRYGTGTTGTDTTTTASTRSQVIDGAEVGTSLVNFDSQPNTAAFYAAHPPPAFSPGRTPKPNVMLTPMPFSPNRSKQPTGAQGSSGPQVFTKVGYFADGTPKFSAAGAPKFSGTSLPGHRPTFSVDGDLIHPAPPTL